MLDQQIGQDINNPSAAFIDGSEFARELLELDSMGKKSIEIWTASVGGSIMEGEKIYNAMLQAKTKVDTCCVGVTASMAAVIFCAGRNRTMMDWGKLMFHNPNGSDDKKMLSVMKDSLLKMTSRTGVAEDVFSKMFDATTWMDAETAKSYGIATKIEYAKNLNKPRFAPVKDRVEELQLITNNLITNLEMNKELALSLGLKEDASAVEIKNALDALKLAKGALETENAALKVTKVVATGGDGEVKAELAELKNLVGGLTSQLAASAQAAADKATADAAAKLTADKALAVEKATNMVNKHASKLGKDAVASWVELATADFDKTEKMLNALKVNKQSVVIGANNRVEGTQEDAPVIYNSAVMMHNIAVKNKQLSK